MIIAAINDLKAHKIPNLLVFPMMLIGLIYHGILGGLNGIGFSAAGLGVGIGVFLVLYLMGGMGAGDLKLMGAAGAFLGAKGVIIAAFISVLIGLAYAIVLLFIHMDYARSFLRRARIGIKSFFLTRKFISIPPSKDETQPKLSFGIPVALGTMCYLFLKMTGSDFIQDLLGVQVSF